MRARLAELPGYELAFSQPIKDKIFEPHSQLAARLYGDDFNELRHISKEIAGVLKSTPGAAEVTVDDRPPLPQIAITAVRRRRDTVSTWLILPTSFRPGSAAVRSAKSSSASAADATVRFPEAVRSSPEAIGWPLLTSTGGALVPLSQVAHIKLQEGESTINRDMNRRDLMVKFDSEGRSLPALLAEAKRAVAGKVFVRPETLSHRMDRPFRG
jgi:cobalt-zinc-cadmium resistance protein CzcA